MFCNGRKILRYTQKDTSWVLDTLQTPLSIVHYPHVGAAAKHHFQQRELTAYLFCLILSVPDEPESNDAFLVARFHDSVQKLPFVAVHCEFVIDPAMINVAKNQFSVLQFNNVINRVYHVSFVIEECFRAFQSLLASMQNPVVDAWLFLLFLR